MRIYASLVTAKDRPLAIKCDDCNKPNWHIDQTNKNDKTQSVERHRVLMSQSGW